MLLFCHLHTVRGIRKLLFTGLNMNTGATDNKYSVDIYGVATSIKICTGNRYSGVKRKKRTNCLCISAKTISYLSELQKVHHSEY